MPDELASAGVAFDTMAFHEHDAILRRFAEVVTAIGGDRDIDAFEDPEILAETLVQAVRFSMPMRDLLHRKTAGVVRGLGMVGDPEIHENQRAGA
ncbi:hypothetical protein ACQ3JU_0730 (plasmid) [Bradyrhizobium guangxiense]